MTATRVQIIERLASVELGGGRSDFDLNPDAWLDRRHVKDTDLTPAAVLVPLVERANGCTVLLTKRTDHLHDHAGQISFPGGRVEDSDKDVIDAALRETEEEVGIPRHQIEVIGELEPYRTGTGYHISPIVGFIDSNYELTIDEFEVAEVFEVPLSFIFDPANHQRRSTIYRDVERHFYVLPYEDRYIWGATAGMLVGFYSRVMT